MTESDDTSSAHVRELESRLAQLEKQFQTAPSQPASTPSQRITPTRIPATIPTAHQPAVSRGTNSCLAFFVAVLAAFTVISSLFSMFAIFLDAPSSESGLSAAISGIGSVVVGIAVGVWLYRVITRSHPTASTTNNQVNQQITAIPSAPRISIETWLGQHGLATAGITLLVLGIGFFLIYSLQYIGAFGRDIVGLMAGIGLLLLGRWIEAKSTEGFTKSFSQILFAGGVATVYFTVYASYFFPVSQIIFNPIVDILLLLLVATAATWYSLIHYRSEGGTILALALVYLSANIGPFSLFTFPALLAITAGIALLAWRQGWRSALLAGILLSYFTYFGWSGGAHPQDGPSIAASLQLTYDLIFLSIYYVLFTLPLFGKMSDQQVGDRDATWTTPVLLGLNTALLTAGLAGSASNVYPVHGGVTVLASVALLSYILSNIFTIFKKELLKKTALALGHVGILLAIPMYYTGASISWAWLGIGAAFLLAGLYSKSKSFTLAGAAALFLVGLRYILIDATDLSTIAGTIITTRLLLGVSITVASIGLVAPTNKLGLFAVPTTKIVANLLRVIGYGVLSYVVGIEINSSLGWLTMGASFVLVGLYSQNKRFAWVGAVGFVLATLSFVITDLYSVNTIAGLDIHSRLVIGLTIALASFGLLDTAKQLGTVDSQVSKATSILLKIIGLGVVATVISAEVTASLVSLVLGTWGVTSLTWGVVRQDRWIRGLSFGVLGFMLLRVLFYDLSSLETIYRVFSLIILGLMLLGGSWLYHRFTVNEDNKTTTPPTI